MDDLRSLEGVGHLLSEKMAQNRYKRTRKRSTSGPIVLNPTSSITSQTLPSNYIAISAQFPPRLAAALSSGINIGYYHNIQEPTLLKSHSSFVRLDDNKSNAQAQCAPILSRQPSLTPHLIRDLSVNNQALEQSPSDCLNSIFGGGLKLDLNDVIIGEPLTPRIYNTLWHTPTALALQLDKKNMTTIPSPDAIEYEYQSQNEHTPDLFSYDANTTAVTPPSLIKAYSNSLFTLYGAEDLSSNENEDLVPLNTNADTDTDIELELLNVKEDFMEYQHENIIGLGASGIVRKAFHFRSCNMVAIKECRSNREHEINAFIKEAKIYHKFEDNPNIVNILGFGKGDDGTLMMAMEYMDLGSCDSLQLKDANMTQKELIVGHIIMNTVKALADLHGSFYVHNDIKPANILCNKYGEIKLSDFGTMSQIKDKNDKLHKNNGTQRYQSPEKMIREPIAYNTKTDIWSLGVTAYELLFGEMKDELAFCIQPPKLRSKEHAISAECCDFIMKCLVTDDGKRKSASDLMKHEWFAIIESTPLSAVKWPWLIHVVGKPKKNQIKRHPFYNEDLLFMISALIFFYSTQSLDLKSDENNKNASRSLYKRISCAKKYTDQQRIENIAKYALCSTKMVVDRIKVTVAFIKAQINNKHS